MRALMAFRGKDRPRDRGRDGAKAPSPARPTSRSSAASGSSAPSAKACSRPRTSPCCTAGIRSRRRCKIRRGGLRKLLATENAARRLAEENVRGPSPPPEIVRPDAIAARLPPDAVHQGLYLEADPLPSPPIEELAADGIVLVLDQITDPHNVGAIFRSAAAFAATAIVTTARHSPEATGVLAKSASGALEHVPLVTVQNLARAMAALKERGFLLIGLDSSGDDDLAALPLRRPLALVLGAEGKGLRQLTTGNLRPRRAARPARRDPEPQRVERRGGRALHRDAAAPGVD